MKNPLMLIQKTPAGPALFNPETPTEAGRSPYAVAKEKWGDLSPAEVRDMIVEFNDVVAKMKLWLTALVILGIFVVAGIVWIGMLGRAAAG